MSHWGGVDDATKTSIELALLLAKKHFGEVELFGDTTASVSLGNLPFSKITNCLEPYKKYSGRVWPLAKIVAVQEASKELNPFIHIGNDCFLWKRPNEFVLKKDIFSMCEGGFDLTSFNPSIFSKYSDSLELSTSWVANSSIIGGSNVSLLYSLSSLAIAIITDPAIESFWLNPHATHNIQAILADGWLFASMLVKRQMPMTFVFPNAESPFCHLCRISDDDAEKAGISWLGSHRRDAQIVARIRERLAKNPPDLAMRVNPKPREMAKNFAVAMFEYAKDGFKNTTPEQHGQRLAICRACEYWEEGGYYGLGKCRKCGCSGAKLWIDSSKCPIGKW